MTTQKQTAQQEAVVHAEQAGEQSELPVFTPSTDIYARDDAFVVLVDMPGVSQKDVEVHVEENVLSIRGRSQPEDPDGYRLLHRDLVPGDFERSFTLSTEIEQGGIEAQFTHGVLRLVLPKSQAAKPREISVRSEG